MYKSFSKKIFFMLDIQGDKSYDSIKRLRSTSLQNKRIFLVQKNIL